MLLVRLYPLIGSFNGLLFIGKFNVFRGRVGWIPIIPASIGNMPSVRKVSEPRAPDLCVITSSEASANFEKRMESDKGKL